MEMKLLLSHLSQEDMGKIREFARISRIPLDAIIETQLIAWLQVMEKKFTDAGPCPACSLRGVESQLKGRPILEAEKDGLIKIESNIDRELLRNTQYVVCPRCLWWGVPGKM
jgi:hypothetical protein